MRFEWDENKNQTNFAKHGINFETAVSAFDDPFAIRKFDRTVAMESRLHLIAKIKSIAIVLVVFTLRDGNCRVISARMANKNERMEYHDNERK